MTDDPINAVYSYVERAYVRIQAGDILIRCLEEGESTPIQQMVEELVLAGPKSLATLREIHAETGKRKSQILDDLHQVYLELENSLMSYGVRLTETSNALSLSSLTPVRFLSMLNEQGVKDHKTQVACLQLLKNSRELIESLADHLHLLGEIELYLQDWLWGMAYQSARLGPEEVFDEPSVPVL